MLVFTTILFTWFDWQVIKTENFTVIYKSGYEYEAIHSLKNLEYYYQKINALTGNKPGRLPVVIEDIGTSSNGYANPFFHNIHIFTYPPGFEYYLEGIEDWHRLVSLHEFTHIAHTTKTSGVPRFLTRIFGAPFQSNMYSPGWIIEGITVYSESQFSLYEGRLNDGFFESYISTCIYENKFPTIIEATNEPLSFPYGKIYLYGGEFLDFLATQYGAEKFAKFFKTYGSYPWAIISPIFPGLGLDIASKRVYGKTFPGLFSEWRRYEKSQSAGDCIHGEKITQSGWHKSSLVYYKDKIYYIKEIPIKLDGFRYKNLNRIIEYDLNTKREKVFTTLNSSLTTKMKLYKSNLYVGVAETRRANNIYYNGFGTTSVLQRINLNTGKSEILFKDDIRTFCLLDDSLILYVRKPLGSFGSELWIYADDKKKRLLETEYLINEIETDGRWIVVSAARQFENQDLYLLNPEKGVFTPLLQSPWTEGNLSFSKEDQICFIANFDQRHHIYGMSLVNPDSIVCYTKNGFVNSFVFIEDTLYLSGLNSDGFDIYKIFAQSEPYKTKDWEPSPKPALDAQPLDISKGNYLDIAKTLFPSARLPLFLPMDSTYRKWLYGAVITGSDATEENFYLTIFGYNQLDRKPYLESTLQSLFLSPLHLEIYYDYNDYLRLSSSYPFFRSLNSWISEITIGFNIRSFDDYLRKEFAPGLFVSARRPITSYICNLSVPLERKYLKSSIDRLGIIASAGVSHIIFDGELRTKLTVFSDPQNPDVPYISIRGYEPIYTQNGIKSSTEYSHRLLKLRKGLWNPNIFFEDLFGIVFFDYAIDQNREKYYSLGLQIGIETKICFGFIPVIPKLGLAINDKKKTKVLLEFTSTSFNP